MSENRYLICFCPWSWAPGSLQARGLSLSSLGVSSCFSPRPFGPEDRAGLCSSPRTLPIQPPPPAITIVWPPLLVEQSTGPQILLDSHVLPGYSFPCGVSPFAELFWWNYLSRMRHFFQSAHTPEMIIAPSLTASTTFPATGLALPRSGGWPGDWPVSPGPRWGQGVHGDGGLQ